MNQRIKYIFKNVVSLLFLFLFSVSFNNIFQRIRIYVHFYNGCQGSFWKETQYKAQTHLKGTQTYAYVKLQQIGITVYTTVPAHFIRMHAKHILHWVTSEQRCTGSGFQDSSPAGFSTFRTNRIGSGLRFYSSIRIRIFKFHCFGSWR